MAIFSWEECYCYIFISKNTFKWLKLVSSKKFYMNFVFRIVKLCQNIILQKNFICVKNKWVNFIYLCESKSPDKIVHLTSINKNENCFLLYLHQFHDKENKCYTFITPLHVLCTESYFPSRGVRNLCVFFQEKTFIILVYRDYCG